MQTISARQIQREYTKILAKANKVKEPIIVISNNKPQGAIIGLDLLEKMRLDAIYIEALDDLKKGRVRTISTREELEAEFRRIRRLARKR